MTDRPLLQVRNLKKYFDVPQGALHAVDDVSFDLHKGEALGVVGESGCGKSTLGRAILRLHEPTAGRVIFNGVDVVNASNDQLKKLRRNMQIIFQDPFASLNPRMTVFETIQESLLVQKLYKARQRTEIRNEVARLMGLVGLADRLINAYPHELDGGRRQRIGIARALALNPELIVCDEPVSALDVSIQAQILNLLQDLQEELGLTLIFITHDLSVVKHLSHNIAVMYLGQLVEKASSHDLFIDPKHPYTRALLSAIPVPDPDVKVEQIQLKGELTSPINPAPGCRFSNRCPYAVDLCRTWTYNLREIELGHQVACTLYEGQRDDDLAEYQGRLTDKTRRKKK